MNIIFSDFLVYSIPNMRSKFFSGIKTSEKSFHSIFCRINSLQRNMSPAKQYVRFLVAMASAQAIIFASFYLSMLKPEVFLLPYHNPKISERPQIDEGNHKTNSIRSQPTVNHEHKSLAKFTDPTKKDQRTNFFLDAYEIKEVNVKGRKQALPFSPSNLAAAEGLQITRDIRVIVGGYIDSYRNVSNAVQFFNISSQKWIDEKIIELPATIAETHQGLAFDENSRMLYIISGQKGAGCMPATTICARLHVDSKEFEWLPSLPKPRYAPGVAIVVDPTDSSVKHVHVFGGASESRNLTATDHWRLKIGDNPGDEPLRWEVLEPVPDAGTHGTTIVSDRGYMYYTAFCSMDPGSIPSPSMIECHEHAVAHAGQLLHHVSDAGLMFRYPSAYTQIMENVRPSWERVSDMPFPVCHAGSVASRGKLFIVGGGILTKQTGQGTAPSSLPVIQAYDLTFDTWHVTSFSMEKRTKLFLSSAWIDHDRKKLFSVHPGNSLLTATLVNEQALIEVSIKEHSTLGSLREKFLKETRGISIELFSRCLEEEQSLTLHEEKIPLLTFFDRKYDEVRGTWNRRNYHLQYPDVVVFPKTPDHVSLVVKCAKRTGHHVCGRNGKHSYDGTTCTHGIVVDVSNLNSVVIKDQHAGVVRLGAGNTLGRVAVELEKVGLALPMGTCPTVGVTGLTLNGGQGPLSRLYGLTCDSLDAIEFVNADGQIIVATNRNEFADYLWLAKGSGAAIQHYPGIITQLTFAALPTIPGKNQTTWTRIKITFEPTVRNAVELLRSWQNFHLDSNYIQDPLVKRVTAEPWLFMHFRKRQGGLQPGLFLYVYVFGDEGIHGEFMARLLPIFKHMANGGDVHSMERLDALAFQRKLGGVRSNSELASGRHGHDLYKMWKGYSAVAKQPVSSDAFQVLAESIFLAEPKYRRYAELKPLGGAISKKYLTEDTAFWHRNACWWVLSNHFYEESDPKDTILMQSKSNHENFISRMKDSFGGMYAGYVDTGNSTGRDLVQYYGENAERIMEIKRARDPHNRFRHFLPNTPDWTI